MRLFPLQKKNNKAGGMRMDNDKAIKQAILIVDKYYEQLQARGLEDKEQLKPLLKELIKELTELEQSI